MGVDRKSGAIIRRVIAVASALALAGAPSAHAQTGVKPIGPPLPTDETAQPADPAPRADAGAAPAPTEPAQPASATSFPGAASSSGASAPADGASAAQMQAERPTPAVESQPLGAPPPQRDSAANANADASAANPQETGVGPIFSLRTFGALALVIALALALKWILSRSLKRSGSLAAHLGPAGRAPSGVLTVLGRYPLSRRQSLVLLKVDRRVLLLAHSDAGAQTLTEITDPEDVASILVATRDDEGSSMSQRFHAMLRDFERDPSLSRHDSALRETPMTPRRAFARASDNSPDASLSDAAADSDDPVGSLRRRLASLREAEG